MAVTKVLIGNIKGPKGDVGPQGPAGPTGPAGPEGPQGFSGPEGPQGIQGPPGETGASGPQGPQGVKGDPGEQGDRGPEGPQGIQGEPGERGTGWTAGTAISGKSEEPTAYETGISYSLVEDLYFNRNTHDFYKCVEAGDPTTAKWVYAGTIEGGDSGEFEEALAQVQSTSSGTLITSGWYRIAEYAAYGAHKRGTSSNGCKLAIRAYTSVGNSEIRKFELYTKKDVQTFKPVLCDGIAQYFTKLRYTYDDNKAYIEAYLSDTNVSDNKLVHITISEAQSNSYYWCAITPLLTEETVEGVTVTTTYDIPANAVPVTDLDLVQFNGSEIVTTSLLEKALTLDVGMHQYANLGGQSHTMDDMPNAQYRYGSATIYKRNASDIAVILWGRRGYHPQINYYDGTTWLGWDEIATGTDLANYFTKSGGVIDGDVSVGTIDTQDGRVLSLTNALRKVAMLVSGAGLFRLYDYTNSKYIIESKLDGTTTFNGTASGNLPLNGGGKVSANSTTPLSLQATNSVNTLVIPLYNSNDEAIGTLGFREGKPVIRVGTSVWYEALHSGNYSEYALSKSGNSTVDGNITLATTGNVTRAIILKNNIREVDTLMYATDGNYALRDVTNSRNIFTATNDGTNTWYGIASECLPLAGGTIKNTTNASFVLQNTSANQIYTRYVGPTETLGYLGFSAKNTPAVTLGSGGLYTLHHDGNSAKVAIQEAAPSDTSSLWVY